MDDAYIHKVELSISEMLRGASQGVPRVLVRLVRRRLDAHRTQTPAYAGSISVDPQGPKSIYGSGR